MLKKIALFTLALLILFPATGVSQNYSFVDTNPLDSNSGTALGTEPVSFHYDATTNELEFSINMYQDACGQSPRSTRIQIQPINFLQILINNGSASGTFGEQALLVFDAFTPGDPKLSVYAYNGESYYCFLFPASFEYGAPPSSPADQIKSSTDSSWIVSTTDILSGSTRTMGARIRLDDILSHAPLYPNGAPWIGMGFDNSISVQAYAFTNYSTPIYDANGFVESLPPSEPCCVYYNVDNQETNERPTCSSSLQGITSPAGDTVSFTVTAVDGDSDPLALTYSSNVPAGATVTPVAGTHNAPVTVNFSWPTTDADKGEAFDFAATFTDGKSEPVTCSVSVEVEEDQVPTCVITGALVEQTCLGEETPMDISGAGSFDPEGNKLVHTWDVECNGDAFITSKTDDATKVVFTSPYEGVDTECVISLTVDDGVKESSCKATTSTSACPVCTTTNVAASIGVLDGNSFALSKLAKVAASEWAKVNNTRALPKSIRNLVRMSKKLHIEAWTAINKVPQEVVNTCSSEDTCVNVSHVSSIEQFTDISNTLTNHVEKITKRVRRSVKRNSISGKNRRSRWRRIRKSAQTINETNQLEASLLPLSSTVCAYNRAGERDFAFGKAVRK